MINLQDISSQCPHSCSRWACPPATSGLTARAQAGSGIVTVVPAPRGRQAAPGLRVITP